MIFSIFIYLIIGLAAGVMSGLLGIGGGAIIVPSLLAAFTYLGFDQESIMHIAIGTSLSSMVINTFFSTYFHHRKKNILWLAIARLTLGIVIGSFAGSFIAKELSTEILRVTFGIFACIIGLLCIKPLKKSRKENVLQGFSTFTIIGFGAAFMGGLLGLGGGFIMLPILFYLHFPGKKAIGTTAAASFLISLCGTAGYLLTSYGDNSIPWCYGYIYLPAFLTISLGSLLGSFYGVKLAHFLPVNIIRKIFAALIIVIGLTMIYR
ncbi:MAG: hypothetical protein SP4CHLAM5_08750 [Chlamydiia bacterium]|nr:hypothetical protein [Chlamydiia bacterium]MCH9618738.1 hypothetical protein [Chlamydiia bacterium]MCH9624522.1 hypothetical protein [Chlamydiia bacterium]